MNCSDSPAAGVSRPTADVTESDAPRTSARNFFHNVLWSWLGILFGIISGIFLSPYVIHRLGDERYGLWALSFSLISYFELVDFGLKSAVLKYAAHYRATGEMDRLESLVSTALVYFSVGALMIVAAAALIARQATRLFHVSPAGAPDLRFLTLTVGVTCALFMIFSAYTAVLEAYQRFDLTSRIWIANNAVRSIGCFAVVYLGLGLKSMAICIFAGTSLWCLLNCLVTRTQIPQSAFSVRKASLATLRQLLGYGSRTFAASMALNVVNQNAPLIIGHFLPAASVGYYVFPMRLLNYTVEFSSRLGVVTGSKAAEFAASGNMGVMARMAVLVNRYCLAVFLPMAVFVAIFGRQLLQIWINPNFAANSAPLLPVMGAGVVIAIAAQYNSTSILYGIAKHGSLAGALALEALLSSAALWFVVPRHGLMSAALVASGLMIVSRGIYVPYVAARHLQLAYRSYLWGIYARPTLLMAPVAALAWLLNYAIGRPAAWSVVIGGGVFLSASYYALAFFYGLEPEHREMMIESALSGLGSVSKAWRNRRAGR